MELRHLRYFVAVAEELSFTRAAERLHIGQPPLSQQIQALEEEIGTILLNRSKRSVRLSEAGRIFLEEAQRILALSVSAADAARRAGRGEIGELKIGFTKSTIFTALFREVVNNYRKSFPNVNLILREMSTMRQIEALVDHSLDIGFIRNPETEISSDIILTTLQHHPLAIVLPENHRLNNVDHISIDDLKDEEFVMFLPDQGTTMNPQVLRLCADAGFAPKVVMEAGEVTTIIGLIAAGCGISILPEIFSRMGIDGVQFRKMTTPQSTTQLVLARRAREPSPLAMNFFRIAEEMAASNQ